MRGTQEELGRCRHVQGTHTFSFSYKTYSKLSNYHRPSTPVIHRPLKAIPWLVFRKVFRFLRGLSTLFFIRIFRIFPRRLSNPITRTIEAIFRQHKTIGFLRYFQIGPYLFRRTTMFFHNKGMGAHYMQRTPTFRNYPRDFPSTRGVRTNSRFTSRFPLQFRSTKGNVWRDPVIQCPVRNHVKRGSIGPITPKRRTNIRRTRIRTKVRPTNFYCRFQEKIRANSKKQFFRRNIHRHANSTTRIRGKLI